MRVRWGILGLLGDVQGASVFRVMLSMVAALCLANMTPLSAGGLESLQQFQAEVRTLSARFNQVVTDEEGRILQEASGMFMLSRPKRFRWDYLEPYEQLIVSDGEQVWFYDKDLEQITVSSVHAALDSSAALLLSSDRALDDAFRLESVETLAGIQWVEAFPRNQGSSLKRIRIGFRGSEPALMELQDSFGQNTRLEFSLLEIDPKLSTQAFRFVPPEGVDVLRSGD